MRGLQQESKAWLPVWLCLRLLVWLPLWLPVWLHTWLHLWLQSDSALGWRRGIYTKAK